MRVGTVVGVGLLFLCCAAPVAIASPEIYVLGGVALSSLGADADQFGDAIVAALESGLPGTSWTASKTLRTGFDMGVGLSFGRSDVLRGAIELRYATRGAKWDF